MTHSALLRTEETSYTLSAKEGQKADATTKMTSVHVKSFAARLSPEVFYIESWRIPHGLHRELQNCVDVLSPSTDDQAARKLGAETASTPQTRR